MTFLIRYLEKDSWKDGINEHIAGVIVENYGGYNPKYADLDPLLEKREKNYNEILSYFQDKFGIEELTEENILMLRDAFLEVCSIYEYEVKHFYDMKQALEDSKRLNYIYNDVTNSNGENVTKEDLDLLYECNRPLYVRDDDGLSCIPVTDYKGYDMLDEYKEIDIHYCDIKRSILLTEYQDKLKMVRLGKNYKPRSWIGNYNLSLNTSNINAFFKYVKDNNNIDYFPFNIINGTLYIFFNDKDEIRNLPETQELYSKFLSRIKLPQMITGNLLIFGLTHLYDADSIILPQTIMGKLEFHDLQKIEGKLNIPEKINCLRLHFLESIDDNFIFPKILYGTINLGANVIKNTKLPDVVHSYLYLYSNHFENVIFPKYCRAVCSEIKKMKNVKGPCISKEKFIVDYLYYAENVLLPWKTDDLDIEHGMDSLDGIICPDDYQYLNTRIKSKKTGTITHLEDVQDEFVRKLK